jgi:hypothetical protein
MANDTPENFDPTKYYWFPDEEPKQLSAQKLTERRLLQIIERDTNAELEQFLADLKGNAPSIIDSRIDDTTNYFTTPLFYAIAKGDPEKLRTLLKYNPDLRLPIEIFDEETDERTFKIINPLSVVIWNFGISHPEICIQLMAILLEKDSSLIFYTTPHTPLEYALLQGVDPQVIEFLFNKTRNNIPVYLGNTLYCSTINQHNSLYPLRSKYKLHQQHYAEQDTSHTKNNRQQNWIFILANLPLPIKQEIVRTQYVMGKTLLHSVLFGLDLAAASVVLDAGAAPNTQDAQGQTALHFLCNKSFYKSNFVEKLQLLAAHNADFTMRDANGNTPLTIICTKILENRTLADRIVTMRMIADHLIKYTTAQGQAQPQQFEQPNVNNQLPVEMLAICEEWELLQTYVTSPNFPPIDPTRPLTTAQYNSLTNDTTLGELLLRNGQAAILANIVMRAQACGLDSHFENQNLKLAFSHEINIARSIALLNSIPDYKLMQPRNEDVIKTFCDGLSYLSQLPATDSQYKNAQYNIGHALLFLVDYPEEVRQQIRPLLSTYQRLHQPALAENQIRLAALHHLSLAIPYANSLDLVSSLYAEQFFVNEQLQQMATARSPNAPAGSQSAAASLASHPASLLGSAARNTPAEVTHPPQPKT